jgi:hypothetical protein
VVETKGRSLEEIERALSSPKVDASRAGAFLVSDERVGAQTSVDLEMFLFPAFMWLT